MWSAFCTYSTAVLGCNSRDANSKVVMYFFATLVERSHKCRWGPATFWKQDAKFLIVSRSSWRIGNIFVRMSAMVSFTSEGNAGSSGFKESCNRFKMCGISDCWLLSNRKRKPWTSLTGIALQIGPKCERATSATLSLKRKKEFIT